MRKNSTSKISSFFGYEDDVYNLIPHELRICDIELKAMSYHREDFNRWLYTASLEIDGQEIIITTVLAANWSWEWYWDEEDERHDPCTQNLISGYNSSTLLRVLAEILKDNEQALIKKFCIPL